MLRNVRDILASIGEPLTQSSGGGNLSLGAIEACLDCVKRQRKLINDVAFVGCRVRPVNNGPDKFSVVEILYGFIQKLNSSWQFTVPLRQAIAEYCSKDCTTQAYSEPGT